MKFFTPEEANEALDEVRPLVERLVVARRAALKAGAALEEVETRIGGNGGGLDAEVVEELRTTRDEAVGHVAVPARRLAELGVEVKDLDTGLVDFPARHPETGETVLLCWRLGEPTVAFWHDAEEGFAGRKLLPF
jgi:hypothetical protein